MSRKREPASSGVSRRTFLKGAAASIAAAPMLAGLGGNAQAASSRGAAGPLKAINYRTRLVLLGTMGGVSWWPKCDRASSSSALMFRDTIYLIDLGQGATNRLAEAFCSGKFVRLKDGSEIEEGSTDFLQNVKALFFTHLHMDHTSDYPAFLLIGAGAGLALDSDPSSTTHIKAIPVFGPCNRKAEEMNNSGYGGNIARTDDPDPALNTSPGTYEMTRIIWQAYAQAINDLTLDDGYRDFTALVDPIVDIGKDISGGFTVPCDPNDTCPWTPPFQIYPYPVDGSSDTNGVNVWATLVDHHQVFPAFAFRFNTPDGSVVFSGDTGSNTKGNLQALAKGADVLVHEVIDKAWVDMKFGNPQPGDPNYALYQHMLSSHTTIEDVGAVAAGCQVKTLVLNHIVPGNTPISHLRQAKKGFTGKLIIGQDLMQIGIGKPGGWE